MLDCSAVQHALGKFGDVGSPNMHIHYTTTSFAAIPGLHVTELFVDHRIMYDTDHWIALISCIACFLA